VTLITELTSRECNKYLVRGGDIAIVPVGSVEVLGPHLPIGGRCYTAEAFATLLAEKVNGLRMPLTPISVANNTFDRPGSVAAQETVLNAYVRAAMDDLLAQGFRRILLIASLDYMPYYISQEFYEDHGVAAAGIDPREVIGRHRGDMNVGEDSLIVGALRILGKTELAARVEAENARLLKEGFTSAAPAAEVTALQKVGNVGFTYPANGYPMGPNPSLSGEKGELLIRTAVEAMGPDIESLRAYNDFLGKRRASRGMMWTGWSWAYKEGNE
jgi:hypothetical protein